MIDWETSFERFILILYILVKERVETLEEILINSGQGIQPDVNRSLQQKFSVSSVKRDSMVAG